MRNQKIDPAGKHTETLSGLGGDGGYRNGGIDEAEFDEPGGIDYGNGKLYIADTNNHAVRVIDLLSGMVSDFVFTNPELLTNPDRVTVLGGNIDANEPLLLPRQVVAPGRTELTFEISLPENYKLNPLIDSHFTISSEETSVHIDDGAETGLIDTLAVNVPIELLRGETTIEGKLTIY